MGYHYFIVRGFLPEGEHPEHPIVIPPPVDPGLRPEHPIVLPPDSGDAHPEHPIFLPPYPAHPIVIPPGDINPPIDIGLHPEHPIVIPLPPVDPDAPHPEHPIYLPPDMPGGGVPPLPIFDPDQLPEHPDLPNLDRGAWLWVKVAPGDPEVAAGELKYAFVPTPGPYVENPIFTQPNEPGEQFQPGEWVGIIYSGNFMWAWVPSTPPEG